jgi:hypothetical protein
MATAVEHLVTGETMQISTSREQRRRFNIFPRVHFVALVRCNIYSKSWRVKFLQCYFELHSPFDLLSLLISSGMDSKISAAWNTTCRRRTTKQHH